MDKKAKLNLLRFLVPGGLLLALAWHAGLMGALLGKGYPQNSFLFNPQWFMSDLHELTQVSAGLAPYTDPEALRSAYPPFMHLLAFPFSLISPAADAYLFLLLAIAAFASFAWKPLKADSRTGTLLNAMLVVCASYPFLYLVNRGNLELLAFVFSAAGAASYLKGRHAASALLFALGTACKIYPAAFFLLFLLDRRYVYAATGAALSALLTFASFHFLHGTIQDNLRIWIADMGAYNSEYVLNGYGLVFGHSLYGALHAVLSLAAGKPLLGSFEFLVKLYPFLALALAVLTAWRAKHQAAPWKKLLAAVLFMNILPFISGDYRLVYFFLPLFAFLAAEPEPGDRLSVILFGLLLVPKHFFYLGGTEISLSALLTPATALWLFYAATSGTKTKTGPGTGPRPAL